MRGEILALHKRGYSWEEVPAMVSRGGCRVAAARLRTELSRRGAAARSKKPEPAREEKNVANVANAAVHKRGHVKAPATSPAKASAPRQARARGRFWQFSGPRRQRSLKELHMAPNIYWVGGGKGGVGKSMVSMALLGKGVPALLVESDTSSCGGEHPGV